MKCLREKEEAIKDHLATGRPCCNGCPLTSEIQAALRNPPSFKRHDNSKNKSSQNDFLSAAFEFIVWLVIGLFTYYLTYEVNEWNQILAIIASVLWPITACIALYYHLGVFIIGLF